MYGYVCIDIHIYIYIYVFINLSDVEDQSSNRAALPPPRGLQLDHRRFDGVFPVSNFSVRGVYWWFNGGLMG